MAPAFTTGPGVGEDAASCAGGHTCGHAGINLWLQPKRC